MTSTATSSATDPSSLLRLTAALILALGLFGPADAHAGEPAAPALDDAPITQIFPAVTAMVGKLETQQPSASTAEASAAPWLDREPWLLDALLEGEIVERERIGRGVTNPWKIEAEYQGERIQAIFKPIESRNYQGTQESYQAEVAAYRLSRFLGLDMVPPTVERRIGRRWGSVQLWVHGYRLHAEVANLHREDPIEWSEQMARMRFFDELIDNPDRHDANFLVDDAGDVVLIDHSRAMDFESPGRAREAALPNRFDRELVEKARLLDQSTLEEILGDILRTADIKGLLSSRDRLLEHADQLAAQHGQHVLFDR